MGADRGALAGRVARPKRVQLWPGLWKSLRTCGMLYSMIAIGGLLLAGQKLLRDGHSVSSEATRDCRAAGCR